MEANQDVACEIERILESNLPNHTIRKPRRFRNAAQVLDVVYQGLVIGSSLGVFGGIWKCFLLIYKRQYGSAVKISYGADDGAKVVITYPHLTQEQAEEIAAKHPPREGEPLLLEVQK